MSEMDTNVVTVKHNEFGEIRHVMIDGKPWFVLADVAKALGYQRTEKAKQHLRDSQSSTPNRGTANELGFSDGSLPTLITEGGLYRLMMRSRAEHAERFQEWVEDEVLPQIRQTGQYTRSKSALELLRDEVDRAIEHEKRMNQIETRQNTTEMRVDALEGNYDWFTALGYAKLHGYKTERAYLNKVGRRAGKLLRARGEEPVKRQDSTFGELNTYPADVLQEAFIQVN